MSDEHARALLAEAIKVAKNAYNPRSLFGVGAAVRTKKGNIYHGVNVESVISGLGTCGERNALDTMCTNGEYEAVAIAVACPSGLHHPCGACIQYIFEFAQVGKFDIEIIYGNYAGEYKTTTVQTLLPGCFGPATSGDKYNLDRFRTP